MTTEQLEDLLYCMGMESPTAWQNMKALCEKLGVNYPPEPKQSTTPQLATAFAGYHITTDKVELFLSEKQAIDWRDQYQPGFARVEKLVSGGVVN